MSAVGVQPVGDPVAVVTPGEVLAVPVADGGDVVTHVVLGDQRVSSETVYPGIRYTGRLRNDVANQMPQGEGVIVNGSGSQTDPAARWGDYSSMNVDPVDNCRLWYVNEHHQNTSARGWQTCIEAFRLPGST